MSPFWPAPFPIVFAIPQTYRKHYLIEIRDGDGAGLFRLGNVTTPKIIANLNTPTVLTFGIKSDAPGADAIKGANELWVLDRTAAVQGKYMVKDRGEQSSVAGGVVYVEAEDFSAQLIYEQIFDYSETVTVTEHLSNFFGEQTQAHPITKGTIDASIGSESRFIETKNKPQSILALIRTIEQSLSFKSMFWVDTDRVFNWIDVSTIAPDGVQLRVGKNVSVMDRSISYADQVTRFFPYGANNAGAPISLSGYSGHSTDYIQDEYAAYTYEKQCVIDHLTVDLLGETTYDLDFIESSDAHLAAHAASDGSDIIFLADDSETIISHVLNSYNSSTGAIDATLTFPRISGVVDTIFYMRYGAY